ncbi:hypothetical protein TcWFU_001550 [Taenia crassiceps]|uniref:Uncharacterized protein n=1 Tax=Taenia crassiceps TaxID=6207 RepID=A0ABR4Q7S0_9CEST
MPRLHESAVDLGIEVDKFAGRIEEEKRRIIEMRTHFDHWLKRRLDKEEQKEQDQMLVLEANLERLQKDLSASASAAASVTCEPHLMKALGEVRAAAQRMRKTDALSEYKDKLDRCEEPCCKNSMLEAFIDTWSRRLAEGKHISELPEIIRKLSEEMAWFYSTPVHHLQEEVLETTPNATSHSKVGMSAIEVTENSPISKATCVDLVNEKVRNAVTYPRPLE